MDVDAAARKPQTQPESDSDEGANARLKKQRAQPEAWTHNALLQTCQTSGLYVSAGCLISTDN